MSGNEIMSDSWDRQSLAGYVMRRLEADAFPALGVRPVTEVTASEVLDVLRKVERRGARELAHRLLQSMSAVFRYAIATDRAKSDPTRDLRGALKPVQHGNFAALDKKDLPGVHAASFDGMMRGCSCVRGLALVSS